MADDGFEVIYNTNLTSFRERLLHLGKEITTTVTKAALKDAAFSMRDAARVFAPDSHQFLADAMKFEHKPFYVYNEHEHWLGGKNSNQYSLIETGNLRKHIKAGVILKRYLNEGELGYRVYASSKVSWYAKFVEFGRSNMEANPFMRRAYESHYLEVPYIFKVHIQRAIEENW